MIKVTQHLVDELFPPTTTVNTKPNDHTNSAERWESVLKRFVIFLFYKDLIVQRW